MLQILVEMNIFVCVKQVPDTEARIRIRSDGNGIEGEGLKWILCPYDEFAVEEALRFKEKNPTATVTVLSGGPDRVTSCLRTALAMGCDQALHVELPEDSDSYLTAKALAKAVEKEGNSPHLIFTGKQAIDDDAAQVTQAMGSFLNLPAVTNVLRIDYSDPSLKIDREVEGGVMEKYAVPTPCLIAVQKGINEPRYASLPNIMKAKKKEIRKVSLDDLGLKAGDIKLKYTKFTLPPERKECQMIEGDIPTQSKKLLTLLREEAKAL